jgi:hypothetical protein
MSDSNKVLNINYINRLPQDVVINHILPYTYRTKPQRHLLDIRNYVTDYVLVESVYMTQLNEMILLNDLLLFLYINVTPSYGIENIFENILRRHIYFSNKNAEFMINRIRLDFHRNMGVNTERKIRIIWGLLKSCERANFINKYIIEDGP